ncbi:MAG: NAD(+) synthase, partial [Oscillospiraceae bacterium]|nr:NAD(+) synthase [Oscillospiraceae bacterium]
LPLDGRLHNCVAAIMNGSVIGIVPETKGIERTILTIEGVNIPFGSDLLFSCANIPALTIGIAFSNADTARLADMGATLILYPSVKTAMAGEYVKQREQYCQNSETYHTAALHVGNGLIIENGVVLAEARRFEPSLAVSEIDVDLIDAVRRTDTRRCADGVAPYGNAAIPFTLTERETELTRRVDPNPFIPHDLDEVFLITAHALANRLRGTDAKHAVLGLSGGLDSALAALTARNALALLERPPSDVFAVLMPGFATGSRTSSNARELAELLGFTVREIDIRRSVTLHLEEIGHGGEKDITYENAQARERTQILLDLANAEGGIVLGTGDMSELALGFCTYGGDSISHFGVNADIPKTLARALVRRAAYTSDDSHITTLLLDIVDTPVSPELLPGGQLTESIVGAYELNDFFMYHTLRYGFTRDKIIRLAERAFEGKYDKLPEALDRFRKRFAASQFKRACSPDIARVSRVSLADYTFPSENYIFNL